MSDNQSPLEKAGTIHAGNLATSDRLQRTLAAVQVWASTLEIHHATGSLAVSADIAGLRANGIEVHTRRLRSRINGHQIHEYRDARSQAYGVEILTGQMVMGL